MRYYIEEQTDYKWNSIKKYILDIKDYNTEDLLDEIIKNIQYLYKDSKYPFDYNWIQDYKKYHKNENIVSLIATAIEEKFYVFNDEDEHKWNIHVVETVINNQGWIHRWSNEEYN